MKNFTKPLLLQINNQAELDAIVIAIEHAHDMNDDMLLDEIPNTPTKIRELAHYSDEVLKTKITEMRETTSDKIDVVFTLRNIQLNLQSVIDKTISY